MTSNGALEFGGYRPGALGRLVELMAIHYQHSHGFGLHFETRVAQDMAAFLRHFDAAHDFIQIAYQDGRALGSIVVDGGGQDRRSAHLRWFILAPDTRGHGLGRRLLTAAVTFCRQGNFYRAYLETLSGLDTAAHLYRSAGFVLTRQGVGEQWGPRAVEQEYELRLR